MDGILTDDDRCLPGDITVLPTHEGYVIQRVSDHPDAASWPTLQIMRPWFAARDFALATSNADGTRAWFWDGRPTSLTPLDRQQLRRSASPEASG
jgi:hypothetical protein